MKSGWKVALAAALAISLAGCGYHPLYATHDNGTSVAASLADISIPEPQDRLDQLLRNELLSALQSTSSATGTYTLVVSPKATTGTVITNAGPAMHRYSYALNVNYRLLRTSDRSELTSGTSKAFVSYDHFKQPVAALGTEADAERRAVKDAADDIRMRLSAFFLGQKPAK